MLRPIAVIVSAILLSRPTMPRTEAVRYAHALQAEAQAHDFDPLTGVAIIHYETRWNPTLVSPDGEDYGLAQIRARFFGACRERRPGPFAERRLPSREGCPARRRDQHPSHGGNHQRQS